MSYRPERPLILTIPEPEHGETNPGGIEPGSHTVRGLVELLRRNAEIPEAIYFIADHLEEEGEP